MLAQKLRFGKLILTDSAHGRWLTSLCLLMESESSRAQFFSSLSFIGRVSAAAGVFFTLDVSGKQSPMII